MTIPRLACWQIVALCLTAFILTLNARQEPPDAVRARNLLTEAGRVVFPGDSITQAGDYIVDVQCWLFSHGIGHHIINLGLGSETATDLTPDENAGHVHERTGDPPNCSPGN